MMKSGFESLYNMRVPKSPYMAHPAVLPTRSVEKAVHSLKPFLKYLVVAAVTVGAVTVTVGAVTVTVGAVTVTVAVGVVVVVVVFGAVAVTVAVGAAVVVVFAVAV